MRGIKGHLARFAIVVLFGLSTFWPGYGLAFIAAGLFSTNTLPVIVFGAAWTMVLFLFLPVPLWAFGRVSLAMLIVIFGSGFFAANAAGLVDPSLVSFWLTWGVGALFSLIGWLMIATPLWRFFHGIVPVQDSDGAERG